MLTKQEPMSWSQLQNNEKRILIQLVTNLLSIKVSISLPFKKYTSELASFVSQSWSCNILKRILRGFIYGRSSLYACFIGFNCYTKTHLRMTSSGFLTVCCKTVTCSAGQSQQAQKIKCANHISTSGSRFFRRENAGFCFTTG